MRGLPNPTSPSFLKMDSANDYHSNRNSEAVFVGQFFREFGIGLRVSVCRSSGLQPSEPYYVVSWPDIDAEIKVKTNGRRQQRFSCLIVFRSFYTKERKAC